MTRRMVNTAELDRRGEKPGYTERPARSFRSVRQKVSRDRERVREPHVVPTERDRREFDMYRPGEVEQGYQVRWSEGPPAFKEEED